MNLPEFAGARGNDDLIDKAGVEMGKLKMLIGLVDW